MSANTSLISGILKGKCPKCRAGYLYEHKSVFPLKTTMKTVDNCSVCNQKIIKEYAPGMNYAVSVVIYALGFILYQIAWGLSFMNNSVIYAFLFSTILIVLLQPWLMRLSKTIYLYLRINFTIE